MRVRQGRRREERPPAAARRPPSASASAPASDLCAEGGGLDTDAVSAPFVPRAVGGYCLDPQGEPKTYGDKGKLSMDEVCTTAFDGECEVYKRFGLDRVVVLRYVDGSGAPNSVEVNLSRFATSDGAYAMFTKRVVADGDPAAATVKPARRRGRGRDEQQQRVRVARAVPRRAHVRDRGHEDDAGGRWRARTTRSTGAIARDIGSQACRDPRTCPPAAAALPEPLAHPARHRVPPEGRARRERRRPRAVGYYKDGDKRWRDVAVVRADAEGAKEVFRAFKLKAGRAPGEGRRRRGGAGRRAGGARPREGRVRRRAQAAASWPAVGDEELVLDPATPTDKQAPLKLTRDEKLAQLAGWLEKAK